MKTAMRYSLLLVLALLASACQREKSETSGSVAAQAPEAPAESDAEDDGAEAEDVSVNVTLDPAELRTGQQVRAVIAPVTRGVVFRFAWFIDGNEVPGEYDEVLGGDFVAKGKEIHVEVTPSVDNEDRGTVRSATVTVGNTPPDVPGSDVIEADESRVVFQIRAEDVDGDALRYKLVEGPLGMKIDGSSGRIEWMVPAGFSGSAKYVVNVGDGDAETQLESTVERQQ